jgi:hypothetical protein
VAELAGDVHRVETKLHDQHAREPAPELTERRPPSLLTSVRLRRADHRDAADLPECGGRGSTRASRGGQSSPWTTVTRCEPEEAFVYCPDCAREEFDDG